MQKQCIVCKFGILPLIFMLAFSVLVAGCNWDNPLGNTDEKTLVVSQIDSDYNGKYLMVYLYKVTNPGNLVATSISPKLISSGSVTMELFTPVDHNEYRGNGYHVVIAHIYEGSTNESSLLWAGDRSRILDTAITTIGFSEFIPTLRDTELVSAWYFSQEAANNEGTEGKTFEFSNDGKFLRAGVSDENITWTTTTIVGAKRIYLADDTGPLGFATYSITGTVLAITTPNSISTYLPTIMFYKPVQ
ncbi:MAG: hypothetical protein FWG89_09010 [Treponema sp.]|nr:hypothetical protein [Treponema sp.]